MKQLVLLFSMCLVFSVAFAGNDKKHTGAVVVVDAYGKTVGRVVQLWPQGSARIFMHIDGQDALVWLSLDQMGMSFPSEGPMLFFEDPGCEGQVYARPDHVDGGWLQFGAKR